MVGLSARRLHILALASLAGFSFGCTASSVPVTTSHTPDASLPAISASPVGSTGVGGTDALSTLDGTYTAMIPSNVNASAGEWGLTVADGQLLFKRPDGQSFSPGKVEQFTASELVLSADPECPTQEGTPTQGRYRWILNGATLRFEEVSDSCRDRADTLTSSDWSLRP